MTPEERIVRGQQAEAALKTFLHPAFDFVIGEYTEKLMQIAAEQPWETDRIRKLASAIKTARLIEGQITALVRDSELARASKKRADEVANMPDEKRRWALAGGLR